MVVLEDSELIAKAAIAKAMLSVRLARQGRTLLDFHVSRAEDGKTTMAYANFWCSDHTEYMSFEDGNRQADTMG
jgi:hypothetical protein